MKRINFKNLPDTSTPLNAENLNTMQDNIEAEINKLHTIVISDTAIDFDTLKDEGRYIFITGPTGNNAPTNQAGWLEVFAKGNFTLHRYTTFTGNEVRLRGFYYEKWYEWRLANHPNITTGTEYETGRVIDGKKEYGKFINFGNLGNATNKTASHGLTNVTFTKIVAHVTNGNVSFDTPYGYALSDSNGVSVSCNVQGSYVQVTTNSDRTGYTAVIELNYLKN